MTDQNSKNNMDENIHFFLDDIIDTNNVENSSSNFDINELFCLPQWNKKKTIIKNKFLSIYYI